MLATTEKNWWEHPLVMASSFFCCIPIPLAVAVLSPRTSARGRTWAAGGLAAWLGTMAVVSAIYG